MTPLLVGWVGLVFNGARSVFSHEKSPPDYLRSFSDWGWGRGGSGYVVTYSDMQRVSSNVQHMMSL